MHDLHVFWTVADVRGYTSRDAVVVEKSSGATKARWFILHPSVTPPRLPPFQFPASVNQTFLLLHTTQHVARHPFGIRSF